MTDFRPEELAALQASPRWVALARTDLDVAAVGSWSAGLLRESRVLVPLDVQALYVDTGSNEAMIRLPSAVSAPDGQPVPSPAPPFDPGSPRDPGVHLHWAPPDALLNGSLADRPDGDTNPLGLPTLPDQWIVLRLVRPVGADAPHVRGWLLSADTATVAPLDDPGSPGPPAGRTIAPEDLHGSVGGTLTWAGTYDAGVNRLSFHDPLDDLAQAAPNGTDGDQASYVVAGWWSKPEHDPLDRARTDAGLHARLEELVWSLLEDGEGGDTVDAARSSLAKERAVLGLETSARWAATTTAVAKAVPAAGVRAAEGVYEPLATRFASEAISVLPHEPTFPRSTLVHGVIYGVPVAGPVPAGLDPRPEPGDVAVVVGHHGDDVAAVVASTGQGIVDPAARRSYERILAGFTGGLLARLSTPDGVVDVDEHEHAAGFAARSGGPSIVSDVLLRDNRSGGLGGGARGRTELAKAALAGPLLEGEALPHALSATLKWTGTNRAEMVEASVGDLRARLDVLRGATPVVTKAETVTVPQPRPNFHVPTAPLVGLRGARRSLRHRGDGRHSPDGHLQCRWPSQVVTSYQHVVDGADLVPSLNTGAAPDEVLTLAREAAVADPYATDWLAEVVARRRGGDVGVLQTRLRAEAALRFDPDGTYDGRAAAAAAAFAPADHVVGAVERTLVADELRRFSLARGADPDPVGVTAWAQPWVPLWLEWEVTLDRTDRLDGTQLGPVDLDPDPGIAGGTVTAPATASLVLQGRSPLTTGVAIALAEAIRAWGRAEDERDTHNEGEADEATEDALDRIADAIDSLDLVSASLDGFREQLLGLPYADGLAEHSAPVGDPELLLAGALQLTRARVVDAFGRTLELDVAAVRTPIRDEIPALPPEAGPPALRLHPRLMVPARWLFRLVDPAATGPDVATAVEAFVDQADPARMVNPVAGFLLPDHIDEELEVFDAEGLPLGALRHEPFGGGVTWEIAPGRTGPPDAGPLFGLDPRETPLGHLAAGVVAADAQGREGRPAQPETESALSALLRVIDTTLWTVDTFAALGTEHIAGLVGRPIAVVRARLTLDIDDDLDELDLSAPGAADARAAAYAALADRAFPVRLGELTRADDGLLGYFVDDDFSRLHLVDRVVASLAPDSRRLHGLLGPYGAESGLPPTKPIVHAYVGGDGVTPPGADELFVHPGQVVSLTLLLLPAGKVHLTSGVLPRKALQLARDWVAPGLAVMAPSVRIGPVLIDPANVTLPKVSSFPKDQRFTRRDTPSTWKDDPIVAATQTALFPDLPYEVQEGYVRVDPDPPKPRDAGGSATTAGGGTGGGG